MPPEGLIQEPSESLQTPLSENEDTILNFQGFKTTRGVRTRKGDVKDPSLGRPQIPKKGSETSRSNAEKKSMKKVSERDAI